MRSTLLLVTTMLLTACAQEVVQPFVRTQRKVMHRWQSTQEQLTFAIIPADKGKARDLEFETHTERLAQYFTDLGHKAVPQDKADLIIAFDYGTGYKDPGDLRYTKGFKDVNPQGNDMPGLDPGFGGARRQDLFMTLEVVRKTPTGERVVYQGTIGTVGSIENSLHAMPILIDGMMWDFPGQSGVIANFSHHYDFADRVARLGLKRARESKSGSER